MAMDSNWNTIQYTRIWKMPENKDAKFIWYWIPFSIFYIKIPDITKKDN